LTETATKEIRKQLNNTETLIANTQTQGKELRQQEFILRYTLQSESSSVWPDLLGPYTGAYQTMAATISERTDYETLVDIQIQDKALDTTLLDLERKATQYQKLLRLRQLALLKQQLSDYGSPSKRADHASLVSCEDVPLQSPLSD
jgi:hypothetical protein